MDDLLQIHARPDFDPQTRQFCYLGDRMVGYMFSIITFVGDSSECHVTLDFPRVLPGHEQAADLVMEKTVETLKKKGVSSIAGRVTTMCPADIKLAEKMGFSITDWGYKIYYSYEMGWGKLDIECDEVVDRFFR